MAAAEFRIAHTAVNDACCFAGIRNGGMPPTRRPSG
jgi:hypothetical protein